MMHLALVHTPVKSHFNVSGGHFNIGTPKSLPDTLVIPSFWSLKENRRVKLYYKNATITLVHTDPQGCRTLAACRASCRSESCGHRQDLAHRESGKGNHVHT